MTAFALPSPAKIKATQFRLGRQQAFNPLRGGHHQAVDMGEPLWQCEIETTPLTPAQGGAWKYLLARLRGLANTLLMYDASRQRPLAYVGVADNADALIGVTARKIGLTTRRIATTPKPWGAPFVSAIDRANGAITLDGLTALAELSEGDYGAWDDGPARRLHICGAVVADSEGVAVVSVEPAPPSSSAALPAALTMEKACAEFVVRDAATPYSAQGGRQATLQGVQVIRRS